MKFDISRISNEIDAIAPDGFEVRILCQLQRGSMAHFTLPPAAVSKAVAHHTVEEVWFFISGHGKIWRRRGDQEEIHEIAPGTSISIPVGTRFQLRCDSREPLTAVGTTMPPWPGHDEAYTVDGRWQPTV
jgi:mannose-6-phosphate isomerase-like protein (cupin superfamily)